jgi:hypothetical protein
MKYIFFFLFNYIFIQTANSQCLIGFYPQQNVNPLPDTTSINNPFGCDNSLGFNSTDFIVGVENCVSINFYFNETPNLPTTFPIVLNYLDITSIGGLPIGFNYTCSTTNCRFYPNEYNCIRICGIPSNPGAYPINVIANLNINNPPITIYDFNLFGNTNQLDSSYVIFITDPTNPSSGCRIGNASGIENANQLFSLKNLLKHNLIEDELDFNDVINGQINIFDFQGKLVFSNNISNKSSISISRSLIKGNYFVQYLGKNGKNALQKFTKI